MRGSKTVAGDFCRAKSLYAQFWFRYRGGKSGIDYICSGLATYGGKQGGNERVLYGYLVGRVQKGQ